VVLVLRSTLANGRLRRTLVGRTAQCGKRWDRRTDAGPACSQNRARHAKKCGFTTGVTAALPVQPMTVGDVEHAAVVRLNRCKSDPHHLGLRRRAMILVRAASPGKDPVSGTSGRRPQVDFRTDLQKMPHSSGPRFQDTIEVLRNRELLLRAPTRLCGQRLPDCHVECQAHFVWKMRRFNYGDGFLHASLRDAVIHDVAIGLTLTAEAERF